MEPDPQDPVAALVKVLEGWAAGQERQAAEHAEQLELLRVQAGLQTQALLQLAGGGGNAKEKNPKIHLPKMSADDDAQAFLEAFEVAAEACHWPREEWVVHLLPLLLGEAQQAAHSLPPSARAHYVNIRKAVLDRTGYSPEEQRRRFRELVLATGDRPFAYAQRLTDLARRWLQPEIRSAAGVVEQVVLERFLGGLPTATAAWVRCHRPSSLEVAVTLAEDHLVQHPAHTQGKKPEPAPRRRLPPRLGPVRLSPGARASSTWRFTRFFFSPPSPRLRDGPSRPAGSASDARTGVLAVRTAGPLPPRVPAHGGGAGGPGGWPAYLCSWFRGGVLHSGKGARE